MHLERVPVVFVLRNEAVRGMDDHPLARRLLHQGEQLVASSSFRCSTRSRATTASKLLASNSSSSRSTSSCRYSSWMPAAALASSAGTKEVHADGSVVPAPEAPKRRVRPTADVEDRPGVPDRPLHQILGRARSGRGGSSDAHGPPHDVRQSRPRVRERHSQLPPPRRTIPLVTLPRPPTRPTSSKIRLRGSPDRAGNARSAGRARAASAREQRWKGSAAERARRRSGCRRSGVCGRAAPRTLVRMAATREPGSPALELVRPGNRMVPAHSAIARRVARLVQRREDTDGGARVAREVVPLVRALPGRREAGGRRVVPPLHPDGRRLDLRMAAKPCRAIGRTTSSRTRCPQPSGCPANPPPVRK